VFHGAGNASGGVVVVDKCRSWLLPAGSFS
jgi:hypothetical protein